MKIFLFDTSTPPIDGRTVTLRVAITATSERRETARGIRMAAVPDTHLGRRTFAIDVELNAIGIAGARGYGLEPRRATLTAWWGSAKPIEQKA